MFEKPRKGFEKNLVTTAKTYKNGYNRPFVQYTKEQRKAWWSRLSQEEKARYTEKYEHRRGIRVPRQVPEITDELRTEIVSRMISLGMEDSIIPSWRHLISNKYQEELGSFYRHNF